MGQKSRWLFHVERLASSSRRRVCIGRVFQYASDMLLGIALRESTLRTFCDIEIHIMYGKGRKSLSPMKTFTRRLFRGVNYLRCVVKRSTGFPLSSLI